MPQATLADAFSDLCRRAAAGPDGLPDAELLRRYAEAGDQDAFAALLRRHGRVVWGAALRRTADRQAAEDVFQATFLTLARRAGRLHGHTSLAGWLYTVGVRLARRAARRAKPPALEQDVADRAPHPLDALSARELIAAVDDEIDRLPESLKLPVVLCCLDGLSRDEAAARLGCSFQVLKGRLERGRERLRRRLARRGVSLSATLGGLVVLPAAVPPEVTAAAATAVLGGTVRPATAALLKTLGGTRPKLVAVAVAGLLGLGLALMPGGGQTKPQDPPPAKKAEPAPAGETVAVRVLTDGKPTPGAKVWVMPRREANRPAPVVAGTDGLVRLPVDAEGRKYLSVFARGPDGRIGEANLYESQLRQGREPVVHLVPVGELTGRFTTTDGKPIPGVELHAVQFNRPDNEHEEQRPNYVNVPSTWVEGYAPKTDADGQFRIPGAPLGYRAHVEVKTGGHGDGFLSLEAGKPVDVRLAPAGAVRVRLSGAADVAATKGLSWSLSAFHGPPRTGPTFFGRTSGTFDGTPEVTIRNLAPGKYQLRLTPSAKNSVRVVAAGEVAVPAGGTVDLPATVEPMAQTTGRLVDDKTGKGIAKATVSLYLGHQQAQHVPFDGYVETDADGRFVAYGPPGEWGRPILFQPPAGYALPDDQDKRQAVKLDPKAPHAFADLKVRPTVALSGVVVDEAGKPVGSAEVRRAMVDHRASDVFEVITGKADGTFTLPDLDPQDVLAPRVRKGDAVNVPTPIEMARQDGPATITISPKNACRLRGRVTDSAGKPLAGAKVAITWQFRGLGRHSSSGVAGPFEAVTADADGRFESRALWPGDMYNVSASHDGYGKADSKQVTGEAGQVHDLGTLPLVATGLRVRGTVVGTDGKPVAGVTVFNRGDGPGAVSTTTGRDGAFMLKGFFDAPGFVFAKKDGYRFAFVPVRPGGEPVTVTLRKTTDPPAPVPAMDAHEAELKKFTRWLLERLWAEREHLGGYERNVFSGMARFDPETARKWRDEERKRTGGKTDYTRLLDEAERDRTLPKLAREDIDEALALIPKAKRVWDIHAVLKLGEDLLATDKTKALRAAEEAAVRARTLDPGDRAWILAPAGDLAVKAGNAAGGKKLLAEAAELIGKLPADDGYRQIRTDVAANLAPHDEAAALRLIEGYTDPDQYSWALAGIIGRLAEKDPDRAEALVPKLRPQLGFADSEARLAIAYRVAEKDPDRAERLVNAVPRASYRIMGLARLATLVKDRDRAWRLIDRAMALIEERPDDLRSSSNYGGEPSIAAVVVVRARAVGHPALSELVGRVLAIRPTEAYEPRKGSRDNGTVSLATVLAFADPATARALLAGVAAPAEYARRAPSERRDWLLAAAMADPDGANAVVEAVWAAAKARRGGGEATSGTGLIELISVLTDPGERVARLATYASIPWMTDRPR